MFLFHAAYSLGMIALTTGTALYIWSARNSGAGVGLAKLIGILVIIFSIGSTLCTVYYGIKYWSQGYFENPIGMHGLMQMQDKSMMSDTDMSNKINVQTKKRGS